MKLWRARFWNLLGVLSVLLVSSLVFAESPDWIALIERAKQPPTLLYTEQGLVNIRKRIADDSAAQTWWQKFRKDVDVRLANTPAIPPVGAQWYHWYCCKKCGVHLKGETPTHHVCPKCKVVYSGWPYDDAFYFPVHHKLGVLIRDAAIVWSLTGERRYAERARDLLLAYAKVYRNYPRHDNSGVTEKNTDAGRAFSQILDESVWLIDLLQGYDSISMTLNEVERMEIVENLIRPAADIIYERDNVPHSILGNHQCWHFSAYALAALVMGDATRLRESMTGLSGCRYQLEKGVLADGFWYEGAWGYHFYTMRSLMPYFTALGNLGVQPPARFKMLFDAPFGVQTPDGKLPALNDSGRCGFAAGSNPEFYEQAWTWWRDPRYASWLAARPRDNMYHALYGSPIPEKAPRCEVVSVNYGASGIAVLRQKRNYVLMDYGPHGGWHGHYDKLNLLVWGNGEMFAEDPGCVGYGIPLHWGWYRKSLAHNTLSVDGGQAEVDGKLLAFSASQECPYVLAAAGGIAKGVRVRRGTALKGDLVFDFVEATSEDEHLYEWAFHSRGTLETSVAGTPVALVRPEIVCRGSRDAQLKAPKTDPWSWTTDCREGAHGGDWRATWTLASGNRLALFQRTNAGTLRTAMGGAQPPSQSFRMAVNRLRGRTVRFATVLLLGDAAKTADVQIEDLKDGLGFRAKIGGVGHVYRIADDWSSASVARE